jgi:hypothetical protein
MSTADRRTESITFRTTPAGKQAIVDAAAAEQREFSDMLRLLLSRGIETTKPTPRRQPTPSTREIHPYPKEGKKT